MSSISVGTAITSGPIATSLQPRQRVELGHRGGKEMVTIVSSRRISGDTYSVMFITDDLTTMRMEYNPQTGTGTVLQ
jgi:hypothetical protein